jgi:hypothetical protein
MGPHIFVVISLYVGTGNLPFNSFLYAELKVIALYSYEHKGNYIPTECIGGRFNKISTPLIMPVHSYRAGIKMGVSRLQEILTLQANKWRWSAKAAQIMLIEHTFCLCVRVSF